MGGQQMALRVQRSYRWTPEFVRLLDELARERGTTPGRLIEQLVREARQAVSEEKER